MIIVRQAAHIRPLVEALAGGLRTLEIARCWLSPSPAAERPRLCIGVSSGLDRQVLVGANAAGTQFAASSISRFRCPGA